MRSHQDGGKYRVTTRNAKGAIEKLINFEVEEKEEDKEDKDDWEQTRQDSHGRGWSPRVCLLILAGVVGAEKFHINIVNSNQHT
jgi:hypothetical protein